MQRSTRDAFQHTTQHTTQHTATHHNTPQQTTQHTTTHHNTPQRTTTHHNTPQRKKTKAPFTECVPYNPSPTQGPLAGWSPHGLMLALALVKLPRSFREDAIQRPCLRALSLPPRARAGATPARPSTSRRCFLEPSASRPAAAALRQARKLPPARLATLLPQCELRDGSLLHAASLPSFLPPLKAASGARD